MSGAAYKPNARKKGILARKSDGVLLVYDVERHRAHSLDGAMAALWRACDGTLGVRELARRLDVPDAAISIALERLADAKLLREPPPPSRPLGSSRREWLRTATALGLGLASITVPRLSEAASRIAPGQCSKLTPPNCGNQLCTNGAICRTFIVGGRAVCRCT